MEPDHKVLAETLQSRKCPTCGLELEDGCNICPKDGTYYGIPPAPVQGGPVASHSKIPAMYPNGAPTGQPKVPAVNPDGTSPSNPPKLLQDRTVASQSKIPAMNQDGRVATPSNPPKLSQDRTVASQSKIPAMAQHGAMTDDGTVITSGQGQDGTVITPGQKQDGTVMRQGNSPASGQNPRVSQTRIAGRGCPMCGELLGPGVTICPRDGTNIEEPSVFSNDPAFKGKYQYLGTIGAGGMGVIYKAHQLILNKPVAIKMVHAHLVSQRAYQRFRREGQATSVLNHPLIITVHDLGISEDGQPYMVMDYVDGETLQQVLKKSTRLAEARFLRIFLQVTQALSHAHKKNILHRDIKPSNIMLIRNEDGEEEVRIMDFGIAKLLTEKDESESGENAEHDLTQTGEAVGSPLYMSPEQARGTKVDLRTDLYSLGCVFYECLSGSVPFRGTTPIDTMLMHLEATPETLKSASLGLEFDPHLESMVMRLLEKNPDDRYQTMEELLRDLKKVQDKLLFGTADFKWDIPLKPAPEKKKSKVGYIVGACIAIFLAAAIPIYQIMYNAKHAPDVAMKTTGMEQPSITTEKHNVDVENEFSTDKMIQNQLMLRKKIFSLDNLADLSTVSKEQLLPVGKASWIEDLRLRVIATDHNLEAITPLKLKVLHVMESGATDLHAIKDMQTLEELNLSGSAVDSKGMDVVGGLTNLKSIDLTNTGINDSDLHCLYDLPNLRKIDLTKCKFLTAAGMSELRAHLPYASIVTKTASMESEVTKGALDLQNSGKWAEADKLYQKAEELFKKDGMSDQRGYATVLSERGNCLAHLNRFDAAKNMFLKSEGVMNERGIHGLIRAHLYEETAEMCERMEEWGKASGYRKTAEAEWAITKLPPNKQTPPEHILMFRIMDLQKAIADKEKQITKDSNPAVLKIKDPDGFSPTGRLKIEETSLRELKKLLADLERKQQELHQQSAPSH